MRELEQKLQTFFTRAHEFCEREMTEEEFDLLSQDLKNVASAVDKREVEEVLID